MSDEKPIDDGNNFQKNKNQTSLCRLLSTYTIATNVKDELTYLPVASLVVTALFYLFSLGSDGSYTSIYYRYSSCLDFGL